MVKVGGGRFKGNDFMSIKTKIDGKGMVLVWFIFGEKTIVNFFFWWEKGYIYF